MSYVAVINPRAEPQLAAQPEPLRSFIHNRTTKTFGSPPKPLIVAGGTPQVVVLIVVELSKGENKVSHGGLNHGYAGIGGFDDALGS